MYGNIGKAIKIIGVLVLIGGVLISAILGARLLDEGEDAGVFVIVGGVFGALITAGPLYGLGELVDRATSIDKKLSIILSEPGNMGDVSYVEFQPKQANQIVRQMNNDR